MNLLIDVGNTRIKWAYDTGHSLDAYGSAMRSELLSEVMLDTWRRGPCPDRIFIASVADAGYALILNQALQYLWNLPPEYLKVRQGVLGISLAYENVSLFGVDRWLALLAARHQFSGALIVVSCGTALTVDVLTEDNRHLGGVIVPGLRLMQESLMNRTPGVRQGVDQAIGVSTNAWLGDDTGSGIALGALHAAAGAVARIYAQARRDQGDALSLVLGGGDARRLSEALVLEANVVDDLVLLGMQQVIGER